MEDDDSDFDELDSSEDEVEQVSAAIPIVASTLRPRRNWRDIERMREQRELDGLLRQDAWFDDLDRV